MSQRALRALESIRDRYDADAKRRKHTLLARLRRAELPTARAVARLHEVLCFLRAYPDDVELLREVQQMLAQFARRADLRRHRDALVDSGIVGTRIDYRFFHATATWLAHRWPQRLVLDRSDTQADALIAQALPALVTPSERVGLHELKMGGYAALDQLRPRSVTDARFFVALFEAMPGDSHTRQAAFDAVDASFSLHPGPDTPCRTHAFASLAPRGTATRALHRARPKLRREAARAPRSVRKLTRSEGRAMLDLAQGAMVTRARALEAFSYGNPDDAWLADDGNGLAFVFIGVAPARRAPIAALYGGLTLRNGVPIGYHQSDIAGRSAAVSFNTFETFRGAEAAFTFARLLANLTHAFGARAFSIEPYQLGQGNDEGLASGAWWFYFKLGFRPRAAAIRRLARAEQARLARQPGQRSSRTVLRELASAHLFFELDARVRTPLPPLAQLGVQVAQLLAGLDAHRGRAVHAAARAAREACGLDASPARTPAQRSMWQTWSPLLLLLARKHRWRGPALRRLFAMIRAKAAGTERDYLRLFNRHARLRRDLLGQ